MPHIASQGFVVTTIDTNTRPDQPASRGRQSLAALDYTTDENRARTPVDKSRQAVMGHSMGGGALEATEDRRSIKASIPMTPWNLDKTWSSLGTRP